MSELQALPAPIAAPGPIFKIEVPLRTLSSLNQREHWSVRSKRAASERGACHLLTRKQPMPCTVVLTRIAPRLLDDDNLRGALKGCRDGIADRIGIDDRDPRVAWRYGQMRRKPKDYAVLIEIYAGLP